MPREIQIMHENICDLEVTYADMERLTGMIYRTIKARLGALEPVRSDAKSDYFRLGDAVPLLFGKNEKERVTIEEIKARTRNWNVTADRSEIKKAQEEGSVVLLKDVMQVISDMAMAFKVKLETLPTRIATIDGDDYFFRVEQAEAIVDEALKELNEHAVRECSRADMDSNGPDGETNSEAKRK